MSLRTVETVRVGVEDLSPKRPPFDGKHRRFSMAIWGRDAEVLCACGKVSWWYCGTEWCCPEER